MGKNVVGQNRLALDRHGKLFRDLTPEERVEITDDMESDMLGGKRRTVFTDRSRLSFFHPKARAGKEEYAEGKSGSLRSKGATRRKSAPHEHDEEGRHIPLEGSGERRG